MGWNSWNHFGCDIDEKLIRETARALAENGMRDAGYTYVNIDDCWHGERDEEGFIQPDPDRFPSGMKKLADDVHALGLKLGIYSDSGAKTCAGRPGSQGHEFQDALQYARWGIDYLKYDWCNTGEGKAQRNPIEAYTTMRRALEATGRPIVYSICEWGDNDPWLWGKGIGHLWRTSPDIINCWDCKVGHGTWTSLGILPILDIQKPLRTYAGPGHWNDPDMMEVGNLPTLGENRAHFVMWAMLAAPLIVGTDVRDVPEDILALLTNRELIAIDQDPLGIQGLPAWEDNGLEIWLKPLEGDGWAVAFLNRGDTDRRVVHDWTERPLEDNFVDRYVDVRQQAFDVKDLLSGATADTRQPLEITVPARDVRIYRLTPR